MVQHATFSLDVVGDGPCRSACEALAQSLGIADRVRFHGEVRDVERRFAAASCFVLPSRTEGTPLTVLEAMSCGLPVVATSVGGVPDVVTDGVTGRLVAAGDEEALASAMYALAVDPESGRAMGERGREQALARFDVRAMVRSYEALYESTYGRREARAA
jgi:glycosyltransferase involved in cell wall biosynthesis